MAGSPSLSAVPASRMQRPTRRLFLGRKERSHSFIAALAYSLVRAFTYIRTRVRTDRQTGDLFEIDSGREDRSGLWWPEDGL